MQDNTVAGKLAKSEGIDAATNMDIQTAVTEIVSRITALGERKRGPLLIAVDGRSGAGKSTLAQLIAERAGGVIVVSDDFYSGGNDEKWLVHSPQAKVDEVIDWRRLRSQVLAPLLAGKSACWHPLDFMPGKGWVGWKKETVSVEPANVVILDGAYSARPELADIIDLSILVEAPEEIRRKRLRAREGDAFMERWHKIWDPAEDYYFSQVRPASSFDLVVKL